MSLSAPGVGKVTSELFARVILQRLGARDPDVLVPPRHGVDSGVVRIAPGKVMALTSDPVFVVPAYGWQRAAWFAVNILASDVATTGLEPRWMTVDLNLPQELSDHDLEILWEAFSASCEELGVAVVTGHTGRYEGCNWPMVGGATCLALGGEDDYVTPEMARVGDLVVVTKGAAIEATALFAATFPDRLEAGIGEQEVAAADRLFEAMTVVPEARLAASFGLRERGVTAMHDATEGGVIGGLAELARASRVGLRVELEKIPLRPEVEAVCRLVGIDPYISISEGTLIASVRRERADEFLQALLEASIDAAIVGEVVDQAAGTKITAGGEERLLVHPGRDPFWEAFGRWNRQEGA